jgi:hypothetical protein
MRAGGVESRAPEDVGYTVSGIAVDSAGNIYVAGGTDWSDGGQVVVFGAGSNGNVAPRAVIGGPHTLLKGAYGIAIGPLRPTLTHAA